MPTPTAGQSVLPTTKESTDKRTKKDSHQPFSILHLWSAYQTNALLWSRPAMRHSARPVVRHSVRFVARHSACHVKRHSQPASLYGTQLATSSGTLSPPCCAVSSLPRQAAPSPPRCAALSLPRRAALSPPVLGRGPIGDSITSG
ncbi:Hypothetical protein NTJ_14306 [Nesidiocoris tenuis]|uniref:Uncharacterized protein n=1 Tax=Nesidiocoris tenuis TaxID=355587 RepID=A0ABN7BCT2_9HEMI|nr:Hypothetical protein NTJ_14306 [Nesidiocoris tenuis]